MIIKWIKKKVLKTIINDIKKEMPHLKEKIYSFIIPKEYCYDGVATFQPMFCGWKKGG